MAKVKDTAGTIRRIYESVLKTVVSREALSTLLIFLFAVGAMFSMFLNPHFYRMGMYEGDVALKDVFAPYDFVYSWGIDEEKTAERRNEEAEKIPYVFLRVLASEEKAFAGIKSFFNVLDEERNRQSLPAEKADVLSGLSNGALRERDARTLLDFQPADALRARSMEVAENVLLSGYATAEDIALAEEQGFSKVVIVDDQTGGELLRTAENIITPDSAASVVEDLLDEAFPGDKKIRQPLSAVLLTYLKPNIVADSGRTKTRKEQILASVKPVPQEVEVKKDELIVAKGQRVKGKDVAQLMHISGLFKQGATVKSFLGSSLFFILIWILAFIYLAFTGEKYSLKDTRGVAIVLLNMGITLFLAEMVIRSPQPSYFMPLAFMGMIITLLIGRNIGFLSILLMGLFISMLPGGTVETMFVLLIGGVVGIYAVKDCRRRSDILRAGLFVGAAKFVAIVCVGLMNNLDAEFFVRDGLWGMASGLVSAFLVMGFLPVFEYIFKVSTNITLLELSDLNHPILKDLSIEAPGTYHHSILVGNLAEAACDTVGANSLLARVGSYYHDIGKISKAEYFSENEMGSASRHSNLSPSMSALIISKHVKEGVELAKKHKLNSMITDLIAQHHGTSLIAYFYQKAIEGRGFSVFRTASADQGKRHYTSGGFGGSVLQGHGRADFSRDKKPCEENNKQ